jgi:hypothetical protein
VTSFGLNRDATAHGSLASRAPPGCYLEYRPTGGGTIKLLNLHGDVVETLIAGTAPVPRVRHRARPVVIADSTPAGALEQSSKDGAEA